MGSNGATPESDVNNNSSSSDCDDCDDSSASSDDSCASSDDGGSADSNVSCVDHTLAIPVLKEMRFIIVEIPNPDDDDHKEADHAPVEFKELSDESGVKKQKQQQEQKENEEEGSVIQNANTDVAQEEMIEAFSGKFDDSKVRELIESDLFLREVVDNFLRHHDEEEQQKNDNASANGGSPK